MPAEPSGISEKWQRGCLLLRAFCKVLALAGVSAFWLATPVNRKVDGSFTDMTPKTGSPGLNQSMLRILNMNKLIAALVAGLFATAAFAQASAPEATAPAAASSTAHKSTHKKSTAHKKSHKKAATAAAASSASE